MGCLSTPNCLQKTANYCLFSGPMQCACLPALKSNAYSMYLFCAAAQAAQVMPLQTVLTVTMLPHSKESLYGGPAVPAPMMIVYKMMNLNTLPNQHPSRL